MPRATSSVQPGGLREAVVATGLITTGACALALATPAAALVFPWTSTSTSAGPSITLASAVSALADGGAITGGFFEGVGVELGGPAPLTSAQAGLSQSALIQRVRGDGTVAWTVSSGSADATAAQVNAIGALPDGSSVASGVFLGTGIDLGDGVVRNSAGGGASFSSFTQRLSASGAVEWTVASRSTAPSSTDANGVAATPDGGAIVAGSFQGTDVDLGDGLPRASAQAGTRPSAFTQALGPDGGVRWVVSGTAAPSGIASNSMVNAASPIPGGGVMVTGRFNGVGVDLGDGVARTSSQGGMSNTGFTQAVRADGTIAWTAVSRDDSCPAGCGVDGTGIGSLDDGGGIVTGGFAGTQVDFGDGVPRQSAAGGTSASAFTQRFRADGSTAWVRTSGAASPGFTKGISASGLSDGGAIITGYFSGTAIDLGDGVPRTSPVGGSEDAAFTQRLEHDGTAAWTVASSAPGASDVNGYGVAATPDGGIFGVGFFSGIGIDLGDGVSRTSAQSGAGASVSRYVQKIVDLPQAPLAPVPIAGDTSATVRVAPLAGGAVTGYGVAASPGGASCRIAPPADDCRVTGLANGTAYSFTARATNAAGTGPASPASGTVTPAAAVAATAAAVAATITPGRRRIRSGQSMPVVIKPRNPGTAPARSVVACATMPAGLVIIGRGSARRSGSTACFTISSIAPGQRVNRTLTVRAVTGRRVTRAITGTARADGLAKAAARPARVTLLPAVGRPRVTG